MAEAPTGNEELTSHDQDVEKVRKELLNAQTKSKELGQALELPEHVLNAIHDHYTDAKDSLHCVIGEFLRQEEPKPTWRAIVAALESPEVNLPELARKIEAAHCHSPAATHVKMSEASSNLSPATSTETASTQTSATSDTDTARPPSHTIVIIDKVKEILPNKFDMDDFKRQYSEDEIKSLRKWRDLIEQWQKTANYDLKTAQQLCCIDSPPHNWVCFLTFDCIEKALKAAMIAGCILKEDDLHTHNIIQFVDDLAKINPQFDENLKSRLEGIEWNCYNTRWPNSHFACRQCKSHTCIPSDHFDETDARESLSLAEDIVDMVDKILETHFKKMELL